MSAITASGDLVHYEVLGRGRPVVLLHGWLGSWRYWIPTMQTLQSKYRVYAVDLYGFGDSGRNPAKYSLEQQLALMDDFMRELGLPKAAVIGHGLGAVIAAEYAYRYPDRVPRLLLVSAPLFDTGDLDTRIPVIRKVKAGRENTPVTPDAPTMLSPSAAMRAALQEAADRRRAGGTPRVSSFDDVTLQTPIPQPSKQFNPLADLFNQNSPESLLGRCFRRSEPNYDKLMVDANKTDVRALRESVSNFDAATMLDTLFFLQMPTVLIHGLDDKFLWPPTEKVLEHITKDKEDRLLPLLLQGTRHFPMLEDDRFPRLVSDFLEVADINTVAPKERWRRRTR